MKKKLLFGFPILAIFLGFIVYFTYYSKKNIEIEELRALHNFALENSPFNATENLSKQERKALALPPNAYNEQLWKLTLDPQTGRPMPERTAQVQASLREERADNRGVGGDSNNPWVSRGPDIISSIYWGFNAGRTRGIMFDPNDVGAGNGDGIDYNRVFAGGVSGGLWVNNDITDINSSWTLVPGIGSNIAVTVIISDPNNPNTFYLGSGESYTSGAAVGNGIWKSTDSGVTWSNIFGGYTGTTGTQFIDGIFFINDLVARDVGATTELYAAVAGDFNAPSSPSQFFGLSEQGLYKSVDNGSNWTKFTINEANGSPSNPNDIEIDINNNIWFSTTGSFWGFNGGKIFQSTDGLTFSLKHTIANATRTELETSQNSANTLWVLARVNGLPDIWTTTDAFATSPTQITTEPVDADTGSIPASDFTRGQAFYDLEIEADGNDNLYVGGIDLFSSSDNGATWTQISEWFDIGGFTASLVHADQHAIVFRPGTGNEKKVVFGTDGGVYYTDDITLAGGSATAITHRNKDYNTIQFYYGAIDDIDGSDGDDIIGGTQDNGTPHVIDAASGGNTFNETFAGDGGYTEIDAANGYVIQSYVQNDHRYVGYPTPLNFASSTLISSPGPDPGAAGGTANTQNGSFINEAVLDKNLNILYSNATFRNYNIATGATISITYRLERIAEFIPGGPAQVNTFITDALMNSSPTAFKVSPFTTTSTKLFIGLLNGKLLRIDTADGTPTFNDITGPSFVGSISDIEFGQNESQIFVTIHNYGVTSIWFSSDGGLNWVSKEGNLPDIPVKCILQNPLIPNELIIGTELGVWATADYTKSSPTWIQSYNGMSDVKVVDLDLRSSDNVILASTFGRGMFTSQFTSSPLSIQENVLANGVNLYPSVSDGLINIKSSQNFGDTSLEILNINGQKVYSSQLELSSNRMETLNLNLSSGLYLIKLKTEDNISATKKIIIK